MKRIIKVAFLCVLFCTAKTSFGYTEVPTLVHLSAKRQHDSIGFNLVRELPRFMYNHIMSGKIKLWDSPKKNKRIYPSALKTIESTTKTKFTRTNNIFFNEIWSSTRRTTKFIIQGFSFINEKENEKLNYGYVDMRDAYYYLAAEPIRVNVNGPASLTFLQAIMSRTYHFNLVQFGKKDFKNNPAESFKIKRKAFSEGKRIDDLFIIPKTKRITYVIKKDSEHPSNSGNILIEGFESFFNTNREEFFNIGGDNYFDYNTYKSALRITRLEVNEIWTKDEKGFINQKIQSVVFYINNRRMNPINIDAINDYHLLFLFKSPQDIIKEKKFKYIIFKLNGNYIAEDESHKYKDALLKYRWKQVIKFVKFYE
jgi:hypothetical protein